MERTRDKNRYSVIITTVNMHRYLVEDVYSTSNGGAEHQCLKYSNIVLYAIAFDNNTIEDSILSKILVNANENNRPINTILLSELAHIDTQIYSCKTFISGITKQLNTVELLETELRTLIHKYVEELKTYAVI